MIFVYYAVQIGNAVATDIKSGELFKEEETKRKYYEKTTADQEIKPKTEEETTGTYDSYSENDY